MFLSWQQKHLDKQLGEQWCPHLEEVRVRGFMATSEYFLKPRAELFKSRKTLELGIGNPLPLAP